jgi:hypothetical protein
MTIKNGAQHSSSLEDSNRYIRLTSDLGHQGLELYSGGLSLLCDETEYTGTGRILLEFKRSASLIAYCNLSDASSAHISNSSNLRLCVKEQGQVSASHIHSSEDFNSASHNVKAVLRLNSRGIRVCPNKRKKLFSLTMSILNFHKFWHTELCAETDKWKMRFDQKDNHTQDSPRALQREEYSHTHDVTVWRRDGKLFSLAEAEEFLVTFRSLVSFANGMPTFVGLCIGHNKHGEVLLREWSSPASMPSQGRCSWLDETLGRSFIEFIPCYFRLAESETLGKACMEAVYWYLQSNAGGPSHGIDGALILSHAALHRLALCYLPKHDKQSAAVDIRQTAKKLKIPIFIPKDLRSCRTTMRNKKWKDAPDAINRLRNDLIHPKASLAISRRKVVPEIWRLAQWYIELFILALSGYRGRYSRRTRREMWIGDVESVPWVRRKTIGQAGKPSK